MQAMKALKLEGVYVDVGAHLGNHSVYFATQCPGCKHVVAFEPDPRSRACLEQNLARHAEDRHTLHSKPVHDKPGGMTLAPGPASNTGLTKVKPGGSDLTPERLDASLWLHKIALIKIDTEGLGINVIRSAAKLIKRDRPVIVCEAATKKERQQLDRSLGPRGYKRDGSTYAKTPTYIWLPKERAK